MEDEERRKEPIGRPRKTEPDEDMKDYAERMLEAEDPNPSKWPKRPTGWRMH